MITELRILPPLAIARLGSSPTPLDAYSLKPSEDPLGYRRICPEETLVVECDPRRIEEVRRNWPFLRDSRIDAYTGILSRVLD